MRTEMFEVYFPLFDGANDSASDKAASDKAASDKAASDKAASDKAASDKAAGDDKSAQQVKHFQTQVSELTQKLNNTNQTAKMTAEERDRLQKALDAVNQQLVSTEELSKREIEKQRKAAEDERTSLAGDRDHWKNQYFNSRIDDELTRAATAAGAHNPSVVVAMLKSQTDLVEALGEDGKPSGRYDVISKVDSTDEKTKKSVVLTLKPADAVKNLKEQAQYSFMFVDGVPGQGRKFNAGGKSNLEGLTPAQYRAARRAQSTR